MTFTPNIPSSGQSLGFTQPLIEGNFSNYNTLVSVNHVAPNASGQGKHTFCSFPEQGSNPGTLVNETALYSKQGTGSVTQLFVQQENNGTVYQLTGPAPSVGSSGYSFLPGGVIIQWGQVTSSYNTNQTVTFPLTFPTNCFVVTPSFAGPTSTIGAVQLVASSITTSQAQIRVIGAGASSITMYYIAIGN